MLLQRSLLLLALAAGCAPPQSLDRAILTDAPLAGGDARPGTAGTGGGSGGIDGTGGLGGVGGIVDASIRDRAPDRSPDRAPDRNPPDTQPPPDAPGDTAPAATVLFVVGNPAMLGASDNRIRSVLASKNLAIRTADDNAAANVTGVQLVVLSGSCDSGTLNGKYRDVRVPIVSMESADYDQMGMTPTAETDFGETAATALTIDPNGHPIAIAAGLTGNVAVVTASSTLGWGHPGPGAQKVATLQGMADRVAIFAYPTGAMMPMGMAVAPRVGFFASNDAAGRINDNGVKLLSAAIDWALR
jgi:hypothetical protein